MQQTFSELRAKEVIRLCDAECIGYAADLVLDASCGCIQALCVVPAGGLSALFSRTHIIVPWEKIRCIGRQTILVDLLPEACGAEVPNARSHRDTPHRNCK